MILRVGPVAYTPWRTGIKFSVYAWGRRRNVQFFCTERTPTRSLIVTMSRLLLELKSIVQRVSWSLVVLPRNRKLAAQTPLMINLLLTILLMLLLPMVIPLLTRTAPPREWSTILVIKLSFTTKKNWTLYSRTFTWILSLFLNRDTLTDD